MCACNFQIWSHPQVEVENRDQEIGSKNGISDSCPRRFADIDVPRARAESQRRRRTNWWMTIITKVTADESLHLTKNCCQLPSLPYLHILSAATSRARITTATKNEIDNSPHFHFLVCHNGAPLLMPLFAPHEECICRCLQNIHGIK